MVWSQQTNYELCLVKSPALLCRVTIEKKEAVVVGTVHKCWSLCARSLGQRSAAARVRHRKPVPIVPVPIVVGPIKRHPESAFLILL